jgi:hypothetical protein
MCGKRFSPVRVECYAGYRGEETPRRFFIGKRNVEIVETVDRWLSPDHRYFKVKGVDGELYVLRHDIRLEFWELEAFEGGE